MRVSVDSVAASLPPGGVPQTIVGFHRDDDGYWVAELGCGHGRHVRHRPPWELRPWVESPEGREGWLGRKLRCVRCGEVGGAETSSEAAGEA